MNKEIKPVIKTILTTKTADNKPKVFTPELMEQLRNYELSMSGQNENKVIPANHPQVTAKPEVRDTIFGGLNLAENIAKIKEYQAQFKTSESTF